MERQWPMFAQGRPCHFPVCFCGLDWGFDYIRYVITIKTTAKRQTILNRERKQAALRMKSHFAQRSLVSVLRNVNTKIFFSDSYLPLTWFHLHQLSCEDGPNQPWRHPLPGDSRLALTFIPQDMFCTRPRPHRLELQTQT